MHIYKGTWSWECVSALQLLEMLAKDELIITFQKCLKLYKASEKQLGRTAKKIKGSWPRFRALIQAKEEANASGFRRQTPSTPKVLDGSAGVKSR